MNDFAVKVSIIVPVFNSERFINRCMNSLINQTLQEIEILVFDDCSKDESPLIIQEFEKKHDKVKFIQNENNIGSGRIRNLGVQLAQGKYILFVDSDDLIDLNAAERLYEIAEQYQLEMLVGEFIEFDNFKNIPKGVAFDPKIPKIQNGFEHLNTYSVVGMVWDTLWLKDFVVNNNLQNEDGVYFQDQYMVYDGLLKVNRVSKINYPFYFYFRHQNSVTKTESTEKHLVDQKLALLFYLDKLEKLKGSEVEKSFKRISSGQIYGGVSCIRKYKGENKDHVKSLYDVIKKLQRLTGGCLLNVKTIPLYKRVLIYISPKLYLFLFSVLDKMLKA